MKVLSVVIVLLNILAGYIVWLLSCKNLPSTPLMFVNELNQWLVSQEYHWYVYSIWLLGLISLVWGKKQAVCFICLMYFVFNSDLQITTQSKSDSIRKLQQLI